jgi:hypothetical protein
LKVWNNTHYSDIKKHSKILFFVEDS